MCRRAISLYVLIVILSSANEAILQMRNHAIAVRHESVQLLIGWKLLHNKNLVGRDRHRRTRIGKVIMIFRSRPGKS
jgi:hypothetical protein